MAKKAKPFTTEVDLCKAFLAAVPTKDWTAYAETAGWDILLVRADGAQVGIQAKLRLNADVVSQAIEDGYSYRVTAPGPDFRAVLVPDSDAGGFDRIAAYIGFTIIRMRVVSEAERKWWGYPRAPAFSPGLPNDRYSDHNWYECFPSKRCKLPEYVPDVDAGAPSPVQLTEWKIGALKLQATLEAHGYVTREDFKHLHIDHRRWTAVGGWLRRCHCGLGFFSPNGLGFDKQHPRVYAEIKAKANDWMMKRVGPDGHRNSLL